MAVPSRYGIWQQTLPFALNNDYYGVRSRTEVFNTPQTEVTPLLVEFFPTGPDPSGWRHLKFHPSFVKILSSGTGSATLDYKLMDLQSVDIGPGSGVSLTKVFLFRISKFTSPGITTVRAMKIWASDMSDFLVPETNKLLFKTSGPWLSGFAFTAEDITNKDYWMPTSLPDRLNLRRTDGGITIHGSGDKDVSQWVYVALAASGSCPLGEYGSALVPSGFNVRVTYTLDNIYSLQDPYHHI